MQSEQELIEAVKVEIARCRKLAESYEEIGPVGVFGLGVIHQSIRRAEEALRSNNYQQLETALEDLRARE